MEPANGEHRFRSAQDDTQSAMAVEKRALRRAHQRPSLSTGGNLEKAARPRELIFPDVSASRELFVLGMLHDRPEHRPRMCIPHFTDRSGVHQLQSRAGRRTQFGGFRQS
jgi:hypothetical protein